MIINLNYSWRHELNFHSSPNWHFSLVIVTSWHWMQITGSNYFFKIIIFIVSDLEFANNTQFTDILPLNSPFIPTNSTTKRTRAPAKLRLVLRSDSKQIKIFTESSGDRKEAVHRYRAADNTTHRDEDQHQLMVFSFKWNPPEPELDGIPSVGVNCGALGSFWLRILSKKMYASCFQSKLS